MPSPLEHYHAAEVFDDKVQAMAQELATEIKRGTFENDYRGLQTTYGIISVLIQRSQVHATLATATCWAPPDKPVEVPTLQVDFE